MLKSRFSAIISLILVFSSGALLGALSHRAYTMRMASAASSPAPRKGNPGDWRKHVIPVMCERLKLDDAQKAQLNQIFDDVDVEFGRTRAKWNTENQAIQAEMTTKITAMLRPDQKALYEKWRADREAERERRRARGGPPAPPPNSSK
jgi:Spy/CpxP family protein refolding chaperone